MSIAPLSMVNSSVIDRTDFAVLSIKPSNVFVGKYHINYSLVDQEVGQDDNIVFNIYKIDFDLSGGLRTTLIEGNVTLEPGQVYSSPSVVLAHNPYDYDFDGAIEYTDLKLIEYPENMVFHNVELGIGVIVVSPTNVNQRISIATMGFLSLSPDSHHQLLNYNG